MAVEIAQQFLALSGKSTEYAVTGIVNAPVLTAAMTNENGPWIELSKKLGQLAGRFLKGKLNTVVHSQTVGSGMQDKRFIHTAVLVGILTGQTKNGLNLVNAPTLAQEIGVELHESHVEDDNKAVVVKVGQHTIKGKVLQTKGVKGSFRLARTWRVRVFDSGAHFFGALQEPCATTNCCCWLWTTLFSSTASRSGTTSACIARAGCRISPTS